MPVPKPSSDEGKDVFVSRCMGLPSMVDDFPDNDQRLAVCYSQWDDSAKGDSRMDYKFCQFQVKQVESTGEVIGYGSVFGNVDHGADVVEKGAFKESLKSGLPTMLWSHDMYTPPVGQWTVAKEDDHGLYLEGKLFLGIDPKIDLIHRGLTEKAISGLSIGFIPTVQTFDDEKEIRILEKVDLKEVSLVNFPMNDRARVQSVKARHRLLNGETVTKRELEVFLRDAGMSQKQAKALAAEGHDGLRLAGRDGSDEVKETVAAAAEVIQTIRGNT